MTSEEGQRRPYNEEVAKVYEKGDTRQGISFAKQRGVGAAIWSAQLGGMRGGDDAYATRSIADTWGRGTKPAQEGAYEEACSPQDVGR